MKKHRNLVVLFVLSAVSLAGLVHSKHSSAQVELSSNDKNVIIPFGDSGYRYIQIDESAPLPEGIEKSDFDDSAWCERTSFEDSEIKINSQDWTFSTTRSFLIRKSFHLSSVDFRSNHTLRIKGGFIRLLMNGHNLSGDRFIEDENHEMTLILSPAQFVEGRNQITIETNATFLDRFDLELSSNRTLHSTESAALKSNGGFKTTSPTAAGTLDLSFDPIVANPDGTVYALAVDSIGRTYVAGDGFTSVGGVRGVRIARLNQDGTGDPTFSVGIGVEGQIKALALQPDGKVLIGGNLQSVNGIATPDIVRLNSDGSFDATFDPGSGPDNAINSIVVQSDGKILLGGGFAFINGIARPGIGRLNNEGSVDLSFNPGAGANSAVNSISIQVDGKIVVGGSFSTINGLSRNRIARLNDDGSVDATFDPGTGANNEINSIALQNDGKIVIGGNFTTVNGVTRNRIARVDSGGSLDATFSLGTGANDQIRSITLQSNGKLLIGGYFTTINGVSRSRYGRLNADGTVDTAFNPGSGAFIVGTPVVHSIVERLDGTILIGGYFLGVNGNLRSRIALLNHDGSLASGFDRGTLSSFDGVSSSDTFAVAIQTDGKILVGGAFTSIEGFTRNRIARLNTNGTIDPFFNPGTGFNGGVESILAQPDGRLLVVGSFTSFNGISRNRVARLNSDGSLDSSFTTSSGANNAIYSAALQADGKILIGGLFSTVNGVARAGVARLNSDGSTDLTFGTGTGVNGQVDAVALQPDGKVIIGGSFTNVNAMSRNRIARLNSDGSLDSTFVPGTGANGAVRTVAIQSDGKVLVGGGFTSINGTLRHYVARLDPNGSLDFSFVNPAIGHIPFDQTPYVNAINVNDNGKILIVGFFNRIQGVDCHNRARLNEDGTLDVTFDAGGNDDSVYPLRHEVNSIAIGLDGNIVLGGGFSKLGNFPRDNMARIYGENASEPDLTPTSLTAPTSTNTGEQFNASWTIQNVGTESIDASVRERVFLSTDSVLSQSDITLGTFDYSTNLLPSASVTRTESLTVPLSLSIPSGNYHLIIQTDTDGAVAESLENNNTFTTQISVTAIAPDIRINSVSATPASHAEIGSVVTLTAAIDNTAALAGTTVVSFYLNSPSPGNLIGAQTVSLAGGGSTVSAVNWNTIGLLGTHNIIAVAEPATPLELNTTNNTATLIGYQIVDTTPPDTTILSGPNEGQTITSRSPSFTWNGSDNHNAPSSLQFQTRIDDGDWSVLGSGTSFMLSDLVDGTHSFSVRAVDGSGNSDASPAVRNFTVDLTPPVASSLDANPVGSRTATISWTTNEPSTAKLEFGVTGAGFGNTITVNTLRTTHTVALTLLSSQTAYRARVVSRDAAGNQGTSTELSFTTQPVYDLRIADSDLSISNNVPSDGENITASATIRNSGDEAANATVVFTESYPGTNAREISRTKVSLPANSPGVTVSSASFPVYEGVHNLRVELVSTAPADENAGNNSASRQINVAAPANRLALNISDVRTFPGNDATFIAVVKNNGSAPQTLTDAIITGASWITRVSPIPSAPLAPGEETQLLFRMQTPLNQPGGPSNAPVLIPASFAITGGQAELINFNVEVFNAAPRVLDVTVRHADTLVPIQGAIVAVDSLSQTFTTGSNGRPVDTNGNPISIQVAGGTTVVHAYAQGFGGRSVAVGEPINTAATPANETVLIDLTAGGALQITDVITRELTPQEVVARGVNINDPANNWVYDFTIVYGPRTIVVPNIELPRSPVAGTVIGGASGGIGGGGGTGVVWNFEYISPTERRERWIIIPGDIRILRQFWDATVIVRNATSQPLSNTTISLNLPSGLSFPNLNGAPQQPTKSLGTLGPYTTASAEWVIRGDVPGTYRLTGNAQATGTSPVSLQSNELTVGEPRLTVFFDVPQYVIAQTPFQLMIGVQNDSTIDFQSVRVRIKADQLVNCELLGNDVVDLGEIERGQRKTAPFTIRPFFSGIFRSADITSMSAPVSPRVVVTQIPVTWVGGAGARPDESNKGILGAIRTDLFATFIPSAVSPQTDWFNANNWRPRLVPPVGAPVLLAADAVNSPVAEGQPIQISDLTIASGRSLELAGSGMTISNSLTLAGGNLYAPENLLTLGPNATSARSSGHIIGTLTKQFAGPGVFLFPIGTENGYSPVTATTTLGVGELKAGVTQQARNGVDQSGALQRFWRLTGSGISTNLKFDYLESDVVGNETAYKLFKFGTASVTTYIHDPPNVVIDASSNSAEIIGVSSFSDWTLGTALTPTSAPATLSGRVVSESGQSVRGMTVTITGQDGIVRSARTNTFGYFYFGDLRSGETYVVAGKHRRSTISPQVVTLDGDVTGVVLVSRE